MKPNLKSFHDSLDNTENFASHHSQVHYPHYKNPEQIETRISHFYPGFEKTRVFIAVDSLRHFVTHTFSNLVNIHLQIMHCSTLYNTLAKSLQFVKIT